MSLKEKKITLFERSLSDLPLVEGLDRSESMASFLEAGFPNSRMEKWQNSRIKKVLQQSLETGDIPGSDQEGSEEMKFGVGFSNTQYLGKGLKEIEGGIVLGSLKDAIKAYPEIVNKYFNKYIDESLNGLNALNNALFNDGFFMYIPKNYIAEEAVNLCNAFTAEYKHFGQLRNLIIIEPGAEITLLHTDSSESNNASFTNSVTEIFVGANASFKWYREQALGANDSMVNSVFTYQERDSRFTVINTSLSGAMIRNDVRVKMDGEGCDSNVLGLYLPVTGEQVDNQVYMAHAKPNCVSNELFKGVLNGKGSSIFNGHILVELDAQKTNAYQTNRNIVLSDDANAFAKPFLEIYADDVKCSHGATIGQLDETALFYLQSRGLKPELARQFLIKAFVGEVLEACDHDDFRGRLEEKVQKKLENTK